MKDEAVSVFQSATENISSCCQPFVFMLEPHLKCLKLVFRVSFSSLSNITSTWLTEALTGSVSHALPRYNHGDAFTVTAGPEGYKLPWLEEQTLPACECILLPDLSWRRRQGWGWRRQGWRRHQSKHVDILL